ncbi:MAG: hypothetical protein PF693_07825 [Spirochaetia bacterium]|jgi:hypothetical protein|nr:hypothetical protein [Spirochaetia bacterium]
MITTHNLTETKSKSTFIKIFINFPKELYKNENRWVPWFDIDMKQILTKKHPFFLHSTGEFFLAEKEGTLVGRICVVSNIRYQEQHKRNCAHFFFLDAIEDIEVFNSLIRAASEWGNNQGQNLLDGPLLFGGTCGSGILIKGYDLPAPMTMMPYNFSYYKEILEKIGFEKYFDVIGADISPGKFDIPKRIEALSEKVIERGRFKVIKFKNKKAILKKVEKIAFLYNETLGDHPEDYPLSDKELAQVTKDLMTVASPDLIKILEYDGEIVGYLFAFADITKTLQKNNGKLTALGILRLILGLKNTKKVLFNGMGILPQYQRLGGNALLYHELAKTVRSRNFEEAEIVQIAESTEMMLKDIQKLGSKINKIHRIFTLDLNISN